MNHGYYIDFVCKYVKYFKYKISNIINVFSTMRFFICCCSRPLTVIQNVSLVTEINLSLVSLMKSR